MRIISTASALSTLVAILFISSIVMVEEAAAKESNETKIKFEVKNDRIMLTELKEGDIAPLAEHESSSEDSEKKEVPHENKKTVNGNLPSGRFVINVSAYTAAADECGKNDGITASGARVKENETIACPRQFPFGTKLFIEGFGTYICQDRGGAIKGNKVDMYMKTKAQAFAFGRRNLLAQVVE